MGKDFRKLYFIAGCILSVVSALLLWRGFTKVIPQLGPEEGTMYCIVSAVFFLIGVAFIIITIVSAKREAKREAAEAAKLAEQTAEREV